jgi:7 transmembrane receptor (rhodopsin family)
MVLLILGCFTICWLPYFVVACSQIYRITGNSSSVAYMISFTLAMSNSAMNPVIYAWKNSNFRVAFFNLLKCKSPDTLEPSQSMRSNLHRKSSSAQHQDTLSGAFPNYSTPPFMKKIEPAITAMGITFEEDEDKISTYESVAAIAASATTNNIKSKQLINATPTSVTIKIESDTRKSIIISTTTLPSPTHFAQLNNSNADYDDDGDDDNDERRRQSSIKDVDRVAGNLIVNKLIENYGYEDGKVKELKDNFLNVDSCAAVIKESSKRKSKSASSIIVAKSPNKSNSHGSIYDQNIKCCSSSSSNLKKSEDNPNKNLVPTFHFDGKKYISRSFNSAADGLHKCDGSERVHGKSTELNFTA